MILIINPGSSSIKYNLYKNSGLLLKGGNIDIKDKKNYASPIKEIASKIDDINSISKIAFRVVHGGQKHRNTTKVTDKFIEDFKDLIIYAPIHNDIAYKCIKKARSVFYGSDIYAIFDTSFHKDLLKENKYYALPKDFSDKYGILKYGFHGISYEYLYEKLSKQEDVKKKKIIICHLGSGCSVCAIKDGKSIDTSMGFTPVSGIMSSKRSGDIDPSIILFLIKKGLKIVEVNDLINNNSGLEGLSGNRDMKSLLMQESKGNEIAVFTINKFVLDVQKTIGSYIAEMGDIDILVFSGGIGEGSAYLRKRICENFGYMNLRLNDKINDLNNEGLISNEDSGVRVFMLNTDEQEQMYKMIS